MTSISGKTNIDWADLTARLAPVEVVDEPVLVKKRSRDFFWYSPVLNAELKKCFGDLVAIPKTREELRHCLKLAYEADCPVVVRGGGTGNYGQAVPVDGGLILQSTGMDRIIEIGDGFVRAEAGALMKDVNTALAEHGREMAMFPSTQDIATIGGFVAGGSMGIGSLATGALREPGNMLELKVMSVEAEPREISFTGDDVMRIHHAWGLNGVITEVSLRTVETRDWIACMATFDDYAAAYAAALAIARSDAIAPKLASVVDARIAAFFPRLEGHIRANKDLTVALVPSEDMETLRALVEAHEGLLDQALSEPKRQALGLPHVFEFCYNHTTLQVLKSDRSATYQQIGVPDASDVAAISRLRHDLGDKAWTHHEFARRDGAVISIDLPIVWATTAKEIAEVDDIYRAHGFTVYDAHTSKVERGGLHDVDYRHLAWKKRLDPKGLMNSAKSVAWEMVKDLSPEEIEQKATR